MSKFISKQMSSLGVRGSVEVQDWLRTGEVRDALEGIDERLREARAAVNAVENYNEGHDLDIEVTRLGDLLIEIEVLLERSWVQLFGPGARIVYDYMRGDLRSEQTTRDTMSDFIASAAPGKSELVNIKRRHLK